MGRIASHMAKKMWDGQERLADAIKNAGGVAKIVSKFGQSQSNLNNWTRGTVPKVDALAKLASDLGVSLDWIMTGNGSMDPNQSPSKPKTIPLNAYRTVPRYNATASAGAGAFTEYAEQIDEIPFTEDFILKRLGRINTDGLIIVDAAGDSMEPIIGDGDLIMIDTHKTQLTAAIYAFTYEDSFFVKRLNHLPDAIEATSDNKTYAPFIIAKEQMNRVQILGRVVWVGHTP